MTFTPSFTGKMLDECSGLYYFNARWYDSEMGRFTTQDSARDGVNWGNYCNSNPVTRIDWTGLFYYKKDGQHSKYEGTLEFVFRDNDGTGNEFNSYRYIYINDGIKTRLVYRGIIGDNCREDTNGTKGMTEPDGVYYYTSSKYNKNKNGTYNSGSYKNVLRKQTKDPNIPKEVRDEINNGYYLFHPNQNKNSDKPYANNKLPLGDGCEIGQEEHDIFIEKLLEGVTNIEYEIKRIVLSRDKVQTKEEMIKTAKDIKKYEEAKKSK